MPFNWGLALIRAHRIAHELRHVGLGGRQANPPILYLPGILGAQLYDRQLQMPVWGDSRGILFHRPEHASYAFDEEGEQHARVLANETIHAFNIVPGLVDTLVTAEVKLVLRHALGYREGCDLFFVAHDWRADNRHVAARLDLEVARLKTMFGPRQKIVLIGQSSACLAIRYWMRTTSDENRASIGKWYAFGPPWQGTFQPLFMMMEGYWPAGRKFHGFTGDDVSTCLGVFQLLPVEPHVVDRQGREISSFDLYDPACWHDYRLGPYRTDPCSEVAQRARKNLAKNLECARSFQSAVRGESIPESQVPQTWYLTDTDHALSKAVYDRPKWYLSATAIRRHTPELFDSVMAVGDDHLPLKPLLDERLGPVVRDPVNHPWGENFVFVSKAKTHRALINDFSKLRSLAFDLAVERRRP